MEVTCTCGTTFEARHAKARYCSDRCRKRKVKADAAGADVVALPTSTEEKSPRRGAVEAATVAALEEADRLGSPLGAMCVALARRLDFPVMDTGSAMAAVAKQLEALLTSATKGAGAATAPRQLQDELAASVPTPITAATTEFATLAEVKKHANISPTKTSDDDELSLFRDAAQEAVEHLIGPVLHRTVTETVSVSNGRALLSETPVMALTEIPQGCSLKVPTLSRCQVSGRRVPVVARRRVSVRAWWSRRR